MTGQAAPARRRRAAPGTAAAVMGEDGPGQLASQVAGQIRDLQKLSPTLRAYHTHDARRSPSGWCDWVIGGPGGVLFRELKREGKNPTAAQQEWISLLAAAGLDADVWRPSDLLSGRVGRELAAVAGLGAR